MKLSEIFMEGKLSVSDYRENSDPEIDKIIQTHFHGNVLKFVMLGNAFRNGLPDPLTIYRGIHLDDPQDWSKNLVRGVGRDLGVSWTQRFGTSINENGPEGGFGRPQNGPTNAVMMATVDHDAVDWYTSFASQDSAEPEIRLLKGASVHLVEMLLLNFTNRDMLGKVERKHITRSVALNLDLRA